MWGIVERKSCKSERLGKVASGARHICNTTPFDVKDEVSAPDPKPVPVVRDILEVKVVQGVLVRPVVPIERRRRQVLQQVVDFRRRLVDIHVADEVPIHEVGEGVQFILISL